MDAETVRYAIKAITPFKTELAGMTPSLNVITGRATDPALLFVLIAVIATVGLFYAGH